MRKLDEGIDIFEGLEEYVKDPAAFGRPSDQEILEMEASAAVIEKMPRSKTKKIQREEELVPKAVDRTKWTKLSHMVSTQQYGPSYQRAHRRTEKELLAKIFVPSSSRVTSVTTTDSVANTNTSTR